MCECVCALSALVGGAAGGLWEPEQPVPRCGDSKAGAGQPRLNAPNLQPSFFTDFNSGHHGHFPPQQRPLSCFAHKQTGGEDGGVSSGLQRVSVMIKHHFGPSL